MTQSAPRDRAARTEAAELLQARGNNFGQVRLLRAVGDLDRLIQVAVLQSAGHLRSKLTRLLAGSGEIEQRSMITASDQIDMTNRMPTITLGSSSCDPTCRPARTSLPAHPGTGRARTKGARGMSGSCNMGENHWNLSSGFLDRKLNSVDLPSSYRCESLARSASKIAC